MYLHKDIFDLTKVLKMNIFPRLVTISNDPVVCDGVRDLRADHSDHRDRAGDPGAENLCRDQRLVPDDHTRLDDDARDGDAALLCCGDFVCGGADDRDDGEGVTNFNEFSRYHYAT
ncbi:hypothetical protein SDC9_41126 [bioreactor metagenome]|uniref:Uncharacterized protein n=1 Tax=bioreactor metagenome TaxID=1076179 RepID=A0A644VXB5_9ZZZZ